MSDELGPGEGKKPEEEFPGPRDRRFANQLTATMIMFEVLIGVVGLVGGHWTGVQWSAYFHYQARALVLGVVAGGALFGFNAILLFTGGRKNPFYRWIYRPFARALLKPLKMLSFEDIIFISLLSGFAEEILFRGWILSSFQNEMIGLVVSSILFGIIHIWSQQGIGYGIYAVVMGFFLGGLFLYSGNIWTPILAHMFNNLLGMSAMKYEFTPGIKKN